ncbi:MAG: RNA polymerase sigma factor [Anaerolineales bacterium]|nr:RNA polymerase sigma factor [Anaerolineales bacterium]
MNQEQTAIQRLKQGDISGLEVLVKLYQVKAVYLADLIVRDVDLAQDIVQTAFLRAYEHINQFNSSRPFGPWFLKIVTNDSLKSIQKNKWIVRLDDLQPDILTNFELELDFALEKEELHRCVWEALGKISAPQRAAIVMYYYLGYSSKDLAEKIDVPHATIRWRLRYAINRLRDLLSFY